MRLPVLLAPVGTRLSRCVTYLELVFDNDGTPSDC